MPLYITVSEGPRADQARPVLATGDQRLVGELLKAIGRLGESAESADSHEAPRGRAAVLLTDMTTVEAPAFRG